MINPLIAELPHRIKVIKGTKNSAITNSLKIIYNEYTSSLLNLQTDLVSSNRFEDANKVQNEYHQNLTYITLLNRGSYQFVFSPTKPLPSEASIYRETRNSKTQILLKRHIDNYINELKKAQAFYMSNRDLVSSRKATDELRLATLELSKLENRLDKSTQSVLENQFVNQSYPPDAVQYNKNFYKVFKPNKNSNYSKMRTRCFQMGGHLAYIENVDENKFVHDLILRLGNTIDLRKINYAFIGGSDSETEGQWRWLNGKKINWFNWDTNEPGNYKPEKEDFLGMKMDGTWCDASNYSKQHNYLFVCEWEGKL